MQPPGAHPLLLRASANPFRTLRSPLCRMLETAPTVGAAIKDAHHSQTSHDLSIYCDLTIQPSCIPAVGRNHIQYGHCGVHHRDLNFRPGMPYSLRTAWVLHLFLPGEIRMYPTVTVRRASGCSSCPSSWGLFRPGPGRCPRLLCCDTTADLSSPLPARPTPLLAHHLLVFGSSAR